MSKYVLVSKGGQTGIRCDRCGHTSFHPEDVRQRYCAHCHIFHEEKPPTVPVHFPPPPDDSPLYWQREQSGVMAEAVRAYLEQHRVTPLFLAYLQQWICAPCWDAHPHEDLQARNHLLALRQWSLRLQTPEDVDAWLLDALTLGIDPL